MLKRGRSKGAGRTTRDIRHCGKLGPAKYLGERPVCTDAVVALPTSTRTPRTTRLTSSPRCCSGRPSASRLPQTCPIHTRPSGGREQDRGAWLGYVACCQPDPLSLPDGGRAKRRATAATTIIIPASHPVHASPLHPSQPSGTTECLFHSFPWPGQWSMR